MPHSDALYKNSAGFYLDIDDRHMHHSDVLQTNGVGLYLNIDHRHMLLGFGVVSRDTVNRLWQKLEHQVKVDLVGLRSVREFERVRQHDIYIFATWPHRV